MGNDKYQRNFERVDFLSNNYVNASIHNSRFYSGVSGGLRYETKSGFFVSLELLVNYIAGYSPKINIHRAYTQNFNQVGLYYLGIEDTLLDTSHYGLAEKGKKIVPIFTIGWKF